ncbi:hypothetical protein Q3G72_015062 [Acer saccharum]|nr:hypothetical protein Q3G72_015062 [Acer saccharum]
MGVTVVSKTWKSRGRVRRVYWWWVLVMRPFKHYPPLLFLMGKLLSPTALTTTIPRMNCRQSCLPRRATCQGLLALNEQCRVFQQDKDEVLIDLG